LFAQATRAVVKKGHGAHHKSGGKSKMQFLRGMILGRDTTKGAVQSKDPKMGKGTTFHCKM